MIYTGLHQTPEMVVATAIQEDVDAVSLSILSGAHNHLFPRVLQLLQERGAGDIVVFGGGIIPPEDIAELKKKGSGSSSRPGRAPRRSSAGFGSISGPATPPALDASPTGP